MHSCPQCTFSVSEEANFCPQCGALLPKQAFTQTSKRKRLPDWGIFTATLAGSTLLSGLFLFVFHWPIFILGAFLPLAGFSIFNKNRSAR